MQSFLKFIEKSKKSIEEIVENAEKNTDLKEMCKEFDDVFPLEYFMNIPNRMKIHKFYQDVKVGDVIIATVLNVYKESIESTILCTMGSYMRHVDNLKINAICRSNDLPILSNFCSIKAFRSGDKIKAIVSKITINESLEISMNELSDINKLKETGLGLISDENLPNYFKIYRDSSISAKYFSNIFSKNELNTAMDVKNKLEYYKIKSEEFSLLDDINSIRISQNETAKSMRNSLLLKESMKYVIKGVNFYKMKKLNEALQCYNHALSINEDNVDALVARGALRASSKAFESSIEDLKRAVKIDPDHKNAGTYLNQTIVAYSKSLPECEMAITECLSENSILLHDDKQNDSFYNDIKDPNKFIIITDDNTDKSSESTKSQKKRRNKRKKHIRKESKVTKKCIIIDSSSDESQNKTSFKFDLYNNFNINGASSIISNVENSKLLRRSTSSNKNKLSNDIEMDSYLKKESLKKKRKYSSNSNNNSSYHISNKSAKYDIPSSLKESGQVNKNNFLRNKVSRHSSSKNCRKSSVYTVNTLSNYKSEQKDEEECNKSQRYSSSPNGQNTPKRNLINLITCIKDLNEDKFSKYKSSGHLNISKNKYEYSKMNVSTNVKHIFPNSFEQSSSYNHNNINSKNDYQCDVSNSDFTSEPKKENLKLKKANDDIKQIEDFISSLKQNQYK